MRLRAQFRGKILAKPGRVRQSRAPRACKWDGNLPGFSQCVSAVFEKEVRYLGAQRSHAAHLDHAGIRAARFFRLGPMSAMRPQSNFIGRTPEFAFPPRPPMPCSCSPTWFTTASAATLVASSSSTPRPRALSNCAGEKPLARRHSGGQYRVCLDRDCIPLRRAKPAVSIATLAGLLFAAPLNFAAGNLLSIYTPRKPDFSTFGRQNVSQTRSQPGPGSPDLIVDRRRRFRGRSPLQNPWIAALEFLALVAISIPLSDGPAPHRRHRANSGGRRWWRSCAARNGGSA